MRTVMAEVSYLSVLTRLSQGTASSLLKVSAPARVVHVPLAILQAGGNHAVHHAVFACGRERCWDWPGVGAAALPL